jgi:hypothetical protein
MRLSYLSIFGLALVSCELEAQTVTAFKTGERSTGQTKQCYYNAAGREYTKTVESYQICPVSLSVPSPIPSPSPSTGSGTTAFKTGERATGTTKECYYSFAGKEYTKTLESYQVCPTSIRVP